MLIYDLSECDGRICKPSLTPICCYAWLTKYLYYCQLYLFITFSASSNILSLSQDTSAAVGRMCPLPMVSQRMRLCAHQAPSTTQMLAPVHQGLIVLWAQQNPRSALQGPSVIIQSCLLWNSVWTVLLASSVENTTWLHRRDLVARATTAQQGPHAQTGLIVLWVHSVWRVVTSQSFAPMEHLGTLQWANRWLIALIVLQDFTARESAWLKYLGLVLQSESFAVAVLSTYAFSFQF